MNKSVKKYFNYSQREKRGVIVLLVLILLAFIFPKVHQKFKKQEIWDYTEFETQIDKFVAYHSIIDKEPTKNVKSVVSLFSFDPNTLDRIGFEQLGLSGKQANTIVKYRNAGGVFREATDFKKVYGISGKEFKRLQPYINIKSIDPKKKYKQKFINNEKKESGSDSLVINAKTFTAFKEIEINSADSLLLLTVNGIGPIYAKRIISYRNYLGGFHSISQLKEIYGMNDTVFNKITASLIVDSALIRKIDLNSAEFKVINKHPYISYAQTKAIFKYKDLMGEFNSITALIENNLLDTLTYNKVKPYLLLSAN